MKKSVILSLTIATLSLLYMANVSAIDYQNSTNMQFTFNPTLTVSVSDNLIINDLSPGTYSDSNIIDVNVATNTVAGYTLSATVGTNTTNTDLTHSTYNDSKFSSITANKSSLSDFTDNTWGYSYSTDGGNTWISGDVSNPSAGYNGLPQDTNASASERGNGGVLLASEDTNATSQIKFKIGARASTSQVAGTYQNVVNFYAVTNPEPEPEPEPDPGLCTDTVTCMQTMTECPTSPTDVTDGRDGTTYKVQKLADGNCWMLDNLALDLYDSNVLNSLSSANTDIDSNNESAILTSLKSGNRTAGDQYATAGLTTWTSYYRFDVPEADLASKDVIPQGEDPMASEALAGNWKVGGYYNYCAATAGSYCYDGSGTSSGDATSSICPAGWKLPTGKTNGQFNKLYTTSSYGYNTYANYRAALHLPLSGYFYNDGQAIDQGKYGIWWSSTRYNNKNMHYLFFNTSSVYTTDDDYDYRSFGYSVRCVRSS